MATAIKKSTRRSIRAYAWVGSHGKPMMFCGGKIAQDYPTLLHIHHKKVSEDLIPVTITYSVKSK